MAPYTPGTWMPPQLKSLPMAPIRHHQISRQVQNTEQPGAIPPEHAHVILIIAMTSASISLIAALAAFRWFAMMKRSFRHHLIMLLMLSDSLKSLWYLIFPLVVFTRGPVNSSSKFCQAGGFFIAFATEASDYAILMIAIHLALCIFGPQKTQDQSGLSGYRRWIYPFWIALPILAASVAFVNSKNAYVTAGTVCYLPFRPLWYRLALAWIPRYIILCTLFSVGSAITIHVHRKFKRFSLLGGDVLSYGEGSRRPTIVDSTSQGIGSPSRSTTVTSKHSPAQDLQDIHNSDHGDQGRSAQKPEFSGFTFNSSIPLTTTSTRTSNGMEPGDKLKDTDSAPASRKVSHITTSPQHSADKISPFASRKQSRVSFAVHHHHHQHSIVSPSILTDAATEELDTSRHAIERHLRILFIWPVVYTIIWVFPFIQQCLQYTDKYALDQPYWLTIAVTTILALQGGVDATVFTLREQPWRRPRGSPLISVKRLRELGLWPRSTDNGRTDGENHSLPTSVGGLGEEGGSGCEQPSARPSVNWWEEEGRKRRDSVWMGTDVPDIGKIFPVAEERRDADGEGAGAGDESALQPSCSTSEHQSLP